MRQDIQFLRGLAVSTVVLEHAGLGPIAGYLGVDIFFVISGYLITRMVQTQLQEGRFSLTSFYFRRAKRLLPAAFATFALTALAAPYFLGSIEMTAFKDQLLGALTFSANIVLWNQAGYFDTEAALKPLLHIWSLSLEEQYYFLLPTILLVTRMRFWVHTAFAVLAASLACCVYLVIHQPEAAFFLLPSRAWELTIGSLIALMRLEPHRLLRWAFLPSLAVIVLLPFYPTGYAHPGLDAALICLATAVIIVNRSAFLGTSVTTRWMAWIGNPSYSLYLAHWPIISFAQGAYFGEMGPLPRVLLVAIAAATGLALYYCIERPIHRAQRLRLAPTLAGSAGASTALIIAVPLLLTPANSAGKYDFTALRAPNYGLDKVCDQGVKFQPLEECQTDKAPRILVWGDSFAMHLIPGILASTDMGIQQATRSACPPALGYAHFNNSSKYNEEWANRCVEFNKLVMRNLQKSPTIETVVIASAYKAFTMDAPWRAVIHGSGDTREVKPIDEARSLRAMANTVRTIRSMGKRVVVVAPPPSSGLDSSMCTERRLSGLMVFGNSDCFVTKADDDRYYEKEKRLLAKLSRQADVAVVDLREWLCDAKRCATIVDNTPVYRDRSHLSVAVSMIVGKQNRLSEILVQEAR